MSSKEINYTMEVERVIIKEGDELNDLLICLICQNILNEPQECSLCQRGFCISCVEKLTPKKCPTCKSSIFTQAHIQTKHNLNNLQFNFIGCPCIIKYKDFFAHEQMCPKNQSECTICKEKVYKGDTEEHRVVCPMKSINCDFCKCEMKLKELEGHLDSLCEVKTEDCLCGEVVTAINSKSHSEVCVKKDQIYLLFIEKS